MNMQAAKELAIAAGAYDSAEFDLIVPVPDHVLHCRFVNAELGLFRIVNPPADFQSFPYQIGNFVAGENFTVENFHVPDPPAPASDRAISDAFHYLWSQAVGKLGYEKDDWKLLGEQLTSRGIPV